jgi:hypothetical protein
MNSWKQFWALLKFQPSVNPAIFFMPVMFALPLLIGHLSRPSLDLVLSNQSLFWVGFIAVMWIAPEVFMFRNVANLYSTGTEFFLTRAVDRSLVCRVRMVFFYFLILIIPFVVLLIAAGTPSLQLDEYSKLSHREILAHLPGSIPAAPDNHGRSTGITLPSGNLLAGAWHLWTCLLAAVAAQVFIFLIYPFKYRRALFFTVYFGVIFGPVLFMFYNLKHIAGRPEELSLDERLFFTFAAHQPELWILTGAAVILGELWCERRFVRMEQ